MYHSLNTSPCVLLSIRSLSDSLSTRSANRLDVLYTSSYGQIIDVLLHRNRPGHSVRLGSMDLGHPAIGLPLGTFDNEAQMSLVPWPRS